MVPPVGVGGIEYLGVPSAGQGNSDKLAVVHIESRELRIVRELFESTSIMKGHRDYSTESLVSLPFPEPFEESIPGSWLTGEGEFLLILP